VAGLLDKPDGLDVAPAFGCIHHASTGAKRR